MVTISAILFPVTTEHSFSAEKTFGEMDSQPFTALEVENLQRLIDPTPEFRGDLIKDEEIEDMDILFFSQYGHLEGTGSDSNINVLQGVEQPTSRDTPATQVASSAASSARGVAAPLGLTPVKYKEHDGKSTRIFECGICGKEFGHQYTLMRHLPTHTDERNFHCLTCGKSFRQMSTLSQHRAIHSTERPYVCQVCNKTFNRVSTLISHTKTHTGVKPHRCHLCNKAFHQKGNLRNHIFTHTNERPYKCDICEKGFNQMSNLMCHKIKTHQNQNCVIPRYLCKICGVEFTKRISLRQHEQHKHGLMASSVLPMEITSNSNNELKVYASAIVVDPINTDAMKLALSSGDTPFALLRPLSGIPVLVRVIPTGDKQMLVPATAEDLKKYGHISIRPKVPSEEEKENAKGCVVQIKVPVVATVIQKCNAANGNVSMNVLSPGHGDILDERGANMADLSGDSFVYTSTLMTDDTEGSQNRTSGSVVSFGFDDKYDQLMGTNNEEGSKNLDINAMEFSFEIPQDARDIPAPVQSDFGTTQSKK